MCYSTETSLTAWVVANAIALYLFQRNKNYDRWNSGFIAIFSTIQLLEAGIWWTMDEGSPKSNPSNELLTKMMLLVLMLQPLAQTYLGAQYTGKSVLYYMSLVYFGILLWALFFRVGRAKPGQFYTSKGKGGHLVWHDTESPGSFLSMGTKWIGFIYMLGMFVPLFFAKQCRAIPLLITGGVTALYSYFNAKPGEFSTLWCYYAILYAVVAIFV